MNHRRSLSSFVVALLMAMPAVAAVPTGVSPGAPEAFAPAASGCPTFLWAAPAGAGFELVVQSAAGGEEIVLRHELPAAASGWTPPADRCLAPGRYGWSVRDLGEASASPWSAPLFFTVVEASASVDLEAAIALLRERLAGDPEARRRLVEALAPAATSSSPTDARRDRALAGKAALAAGTAIYGEVAGPSGETYGVRGVVSSPAGAGVRAENLASGPIPAADLILGHPTEPAKVSEVGLSRSSAANLSFDFANPGAGTMTLRVDGAAVLTDGDPTVQRRTAPSPLSCPAGQFLRSVAADGAPTCAADATGPAGWTLGGNAIADGQFLGTTNAQPLELRADGWRVLRLESNPLTIGNTANVVAGSTANSISAGVRGATIAGGGAFAGGDPAFADEDSNRVSDSYGTVGGGFANWAGDSAGTVHDAAAATVGGGRLNVASRSGSTVAGGQGNHAASLRSTVGGGRENVASGQESTVGGGFQNLASGWHSTVAGGQENAASSTGATVAGGLLNAASAFHSAVGGGLENIAAADWSSVSGGWGNVAAGVYSFVGNGNSNGAYGGGSSVPGGIENCAGGTTSFAGGYRARVRPESSSPTDDGCNNVPGTGGAGGDSGTFVWAGVFGGVPFTSTGSSQFLVLAPGGVGFNTNSPITDFDVVGDRSGHAALIRNNGTSSPDGLAIRLNVTGNPTTTNNFLTFQKADGSSVGSVEGNGAGGVSFNTAGGDYAEWLPKEESQLDLPPGSVVGLRGGRVSLDTAGAEQVAVVSGRPAIAGNDPGAAARGGYALVAFLGQVDVLVASAVVAGDFLVPTGQGDGFARAVAPQELGLADLAGVLGRAWQSAEGPGPHRVRALVGLQLTGGAIEAALAQLALRIERLEGAQR